MKPEDMIEKDYRKKLFVFILVIFFIGSLLPAVLHYTTLHTPLDENYKSIRATILEIKETLFADTLRINLVFYVFTAIGIGMLAILYTHRIAGPLFRIKNNIKDIGEGNLDRKISLRQKDAVNSFAGTLNEMTAIYSARVDTLRRDIRELKNTLADLESEEEKSEKYGVLAKKITDLDHSIQELLKSIKV